jgi:hypothetical protein
MFVVIIVISGLKFMASCILELRNASITVSAYLLTTSIFVRIITLVVMAGAILGYSEGENQLKYFGIIFGVVLLLEFHLIHSVISLTIATVTYRNTVLAPLIRRALGRA